MTSPRWWRVLVILVAVSLGLSLLPGIAAAQSGASGTVIIEEGETVSEVDAVAGTVIVRGTVTGDVSAVAGNVHIEGTVERDLDVAAGNVRISGTVGRDVSAASGNIHLEEDGTVGRHFEAGAGNVQIDGTIDGDATIGAETIRLGETATIAGSLTYDGSLEGNRDAVAGDITRDQTLSVALGPELQPLASWVFSIYAFILNLLLGAVLLALFPRFSDSIVDRVTTEPVRTGLIGLGVMIGAPLILVVVALTVIGIPITLVGAFAFALLIWIGLVYGRFAVGAWLLSLVERDNRWGGLILGLLVGAILAQVPIAGGLLNFVILLLGLGALLSGLYAQHRRRRTSPAVPPEESPTD